MKSIGQKVRIIQPTLRIAQDRQGKRALHTGSKAWAIQRQRVLTRDLYICQACGGFGNHVDHKNNDAELHVTDDSLWVLCVACHGAKTATEQAGKVWNPKN